MAVKSKIAFGESNRIESAKQAGVIDSGDILLLDSFTEHPKLGWITLDGQTVILNDEKADLTELEAEVDALASSVESHVAEASQAIAEVDSAVKATNAEVAKTNIEVAKKANEASVAASYERVKFEIADTPVGTLVDMDREKEIRIMIPSTATFTKQAVGAGGDANVYYITLRTYAPAKATGYKEHLGENSDKDILTDLKVDAYGRKFQSTWLGVAKYDETSGSWTYYGANSSEEKYIGWDYQVDWYENDVIFASDSVRINLSNENCHGNIKPSYISAVLSEIKTYCDEQIIEKAGQIPVVEF